MTYAAQSSTAVPRQQYISLHLGIGDDTPAARVPLTYASGLTPPQPPSILIDAQGEPHRTPPGLTLPGSFQFGTLLEENGNFITLPMTLERCVECGTRLTFRLAFPWLDLVVTGKGVLRNASAPSGDGGIPAAYFELLVFTNAYEDMKGGPIG